MNLDGRVDIVDLVSVANTFGKISGDPSFNPAADLNTDGTINIIDIVIVATNFGASC